MQFPEATPQFRLGTYDLAAGFLHSHSLKWNYVGMEGRPGDLFYRALASEPVEKQVATLHRLGFAGVYIDRRGYEDDGDAIIARFIEVLGFPPTLQRDDKEIVFFPTGSGRKAGRRYWSGATLAPARAARAGVRQARFR